MRNLWKVFGFDSSFISFNMSEMLDLFYENSDLLGFNLENSIIWPFSAGVYEFQ